MFPCRLVLQESLAGILSVLGGHLAFFFPFDDLT